MWRVSTGCSTLFLFLSCIYQLIWIWYLWGYIIKPFTTIIFDHDTHYKNSVNGNLSRLSITVLTLVDTSLAPEGEHLVMLTALVPHHLQSDRAQAKPEFAENMLQQKNSWIKRACAFY
jgi:phytoene dehydrogenase-like protein